MLPCQIQYISFSVKFPVYHNLRSASSRQNSQHVFMHEHMQSSGQM